MKLARLYKLKRMFPQAQNSFRYIPVAGSRKHSFYVDYFCHLFDYNSNHSCLKSCIYNNKDRAYGLHLRLPKGSLFFARSTLFMSNIVIYKQQLTFLMTIWRELLPIRRDRTKNKKYLLKIGDFYGL